MFNISDGGERRRFSMLVDALSAAMEYAVVEANCGRKIGVGVWQENENGPDSLAYDVQAWPARTGVKLPTLTIVNGLGT